MEGGGVSVFAYGGGGVVGCFAFGVAFGGGVSAAFFEFEELKQFFGPVFFELVDGEHDVSDFGVGGEGVPLFVGLCFVCLCVLRLCEFFVFYFYFFGCALVLCEYF